MAGHVACMEENSAYVFLVGSMKDRDEMDNGGAVERIILK